MPRTETRAEGDSSRDRQNLRQRHAARMNGNRRKENSKPGYRDIAISTAKMPQQENPRSYGKDNNAETIAAKTTMPRSLPQR